MANKNDDKARAVLNRWWHMKRDAFTGPDPDRPVGVAQIDIVDSIGECEKWRRQVMVDINKCVTFIQNRALGQAKLRELNDEANKLLREKFHWERRIKELGGPDYHVIEGVRGIDKHGADIGGYGGYRYFGAAKDLPGVKQSLLREAPSAPARSIEMLRESLDFDSYYGDREETALLEEESEEESRLRKLELQLWLSNNKERVKRFYEGRPQPSLEQVVQDLDDIVEFKM